MTDKMRWIAGDYNPVEAAVDSATVIKIGDLLWQAFDASGGPRQVAYPASSAGEFATWHDGEDEGEALQEWCARYFLGVAMQYSREGHTEPIKVATTGVFEFHCPSGTFELGDLIGAAVRSYPAPDPDWDYSRHVRPQQKLLNDTVAKVTDSAYAIARVAKFEHKPVTSVLVDIRSTVMGYGCNSG